MTGTKQVEQQPTLNVMGNSASNITPSTTTNNVMLLDSVVVDTELNQHQSLPNTVTLFDGKQTLMCTHHQHQQPHHHHHHHHQHQPQHLQSTTTAPVVHDTIRQHPTHPHQLAHQHTYPKISLTSMPPAGCIKEEEEHLSDNGNSATGGGNGRDITAMGHDTKRRSSAQFLNSGRNFIRIGDPCDYRYRRMDGSEDEDESLFSPGAISACTGGPEGGGATIPRTFSTSALKMKNRCAFWDRMQTPR